MVDKSTLPKWAEDRDDWNYAGWIRRPPIISTFEELCTRETRSDHGELREVIIYQEGAVVWWKECSLKH
jgi:hypothetical protein